MNEPPNEPSEKAEGQGEHSEQAADHAGDTGHGGNAEYGGGDSVNSRETVVGAPNQMPQMQQRPHIEWLMESYGSGIFFRRWAATVIDFLFLIGLAFWAASVSEGRGGYAFAAYALVVIVYYLVLESLTGFTIGKLLLRIRVIDERGYAPLFFKGLLRSLLRLVEVNPLLLGGIPAGITVLATKKKQRLGDMAADTYVVKTKDLKPVARGLTAAFIVIASVLLAGSIAGAAYFFSTDADMSFGESKPKTFTSVDGQFEITANSSWSAKRDLHDESGLSIGNLLQNKYLIVLSEPKSDFPDETTLDDYLWMVESGYTGSVETFILTEPEALAINGNEAYEFIVGGVSEDLSIRYIVTAIETETHFYQVIAWTTTSSFGRLEEELREVIGGFREVPFS